MSWMSSIFFFFRKWSGSSETQNKHIKFFSIYEGGLACLGLRKFPPDWCSEIFSKYWCTFQLGKKQVELKILIMAHRFQICNKNVLLKKKNCPQLGGGGGPDRWGHVLTFFCDPAPYSANSNETGSLSKCHTVHC